jgi:transposase
MPAPYSLDLREKVIHQVKIGKDKQAIINMFGISESTLYRWIKRSYLDILAPTPNEIRQNRKIIPGLLEDYIKRNPNATLNDIAKHFDCKSSSVYMRIKKLNYSYKKKTFSTKKEMKKKELSSKKK